MGARKWRIILEWIRTVFFTYRLENKTKKQVNKHTNKRTNKQTNKQTNKHTQQTRKTGWGNP